MRIRKILAVFGVSLGLLILLAHVSHATEKDPYALKLTPYIGLIHLHTGGPEGYDDGQWSVKQAADWGRKVGLSFMILTPHANEIDNPNKVINAKFHYIGKTGYQNFVDDCAKNSTDGILIIPGTEFGDAKDGNSHFLILGLYDANVFNTALKIYNSKGQKATIKYFSDFAIGKGDDPGHPYCIVAAHPDFTYRHIDPSTKIISDTKYHFNFDKSTLFKATPNTLELLNNGNVDTDTLDTNLKDMLREGMGMSIWSVTGGCDFHTDTAEGLEPLNDALVLHAKPFPKALHRRTVVWVPSLTPEHILNAILSGGSAALYVYQDHINKDDLPQDFMYSRVVAYDQSHKPATYKLHKEFKVNIPRFSYCWYKLTQHMNPRNIDDATYSLSRLPAAGYMPGTKKVILDDQLQEVAQSYMLVINSHSYFLVTSPQVYYNMSIANMDN